MTTLLADKIRRMERQGRTSFALVLLFSALLVWVGGHSRSAGLPMQPALSNLAALMGAEAQAVLSAAGKQQRVPDQRQSGDGDDGDLFPLTAATVLAIRASVQHPLPQPESTPIARDQKRPEARAPPFT